MKLMSVRINAYYLLLAVVVSWELDYLVSTEGAMRLLFYQMYLTYRLHSSCSCTEATIILWNTNVPSFLRN
ncbi:unnamed protein product [Coffea canephora]|uniref:Uncharacterized protein n=1 Tax=Coffea canephora TaxID=49390 RepID=A0A068UKJ6_COFCA|nr:unnamed protein product [Coffea canephora]